MPQTKQYRLVTALILLFIEGVNPLRAAYHEYAFGPLLDHDGNL